MARAGPGQAAGAHERCRRLGPCRASMPCSATGCTGFVTVICGGEGGSGGQGRARGRRRYCGRAEGRAGQGEGLRAGTMAWRHRRRRCQSAASAAKRQRHSSGSAHPLGAQVVEHEVEEQAAGGEAARVEEVVVEPDLKGEKISNE